MINISKPKCPELTKLKVGANLVAEKMSEEGGITYKVSETHGKCGGCGGDTLLSIYPDLNNNGIQDLSSGEHSAATFFNDCNFDTNLEMRMPNPTPKDDSFEEYVIKDTQFSAADLIDCSQEVADVIKSNFLK